MFTLSRATEEKINDVLFMRLMILGSLNGVHQLVQSPRRPSLHNICRVPQQWFTMLHEVEVIVGAALLQIGNVDLTPVFNLQFIGVP